MVDVFFQDGRRLVLEYTKCDMHFVQRFLFTCLYMRLLYIKSQASIYLPAEARMISDENISRIYLNKKNLSMLKMTTQNSDQMK